MQCLMAAQVMFGERRARQGKQALDFDQNMASRHSRVHRGREKFVWRWKKVDGGMYGGRRWNLKRKKLFGKDKVARRERKKRK